MLPLVLSKVIPVTSTGGSSVSFALTVTVHVALFSPAVAVISAVPAFTPVTTPSFTVAIVSSELLHFTSACVASGSTLAVSFNVSPTLMLPLVLSKVIPVTSTGGSSVSFALTVTVHVTL